ncbi:hypothetical protein N825_29320 [Skermanella stibiiresistens SB22]|uniref:Peptidase n=2 Tax=Skermanella TaxID=204447 RepID=W9GUA3_9PROT|nr:hypothetical protein N825_29320 [Skermanella stibiiresistens SB22]
MVEVMLSNISARISASLPAIAFLVGLAAGTALPAHAQPHQAAEWGKVSAPAPGSPRIFGSYTNGCIGGARSLPTEGPGHQVVRLSRTRYFGHPETIEYLLNLGQRVAATDLGTLLVGDVSQPRGGPMPSGHASHEVGLDADIWLRLDLPPLPRSQREDLDLPSVIDPITKHVDPRLFTDTQAMLLRLAADDPRVTRIFVAPGIKQALCERTWPDRSWLRLIRPWFGHEAHFHVRMTCPPDQPQCADQAPPPPGDGCGAELASWFEKPPPVPTPAPPPKVKPEPPPMPVACAGILVMPPH